MLHGAIGSSTQIEPLANELKNDFRVTLYNFPGHAGKEIPDEPFSIRFFAEDLKNFLVKSRLNGIDVYGYSMGGYIALYIARHFPGVVNAIFTTATKFDWNEATSVKESKLLIPEKIEEKLPKFAEQLSERHTKEKWKSVLDKTAEMMISLGKEKELKDEDFGEIENRVLLGVGDRDTMVSIEETVEVYRKLKNGSMLVLPDTPHPIEKISVERLAYEIRKFFL